MDTTTDPFFRVLCPDGQVYDLFTGDNAERWARLAAADCDDRHDPAKCPGSHRVERCKGWELVELEETS